MTVLIKHYQKNNETQAIVIDSPDQYAIVLRADKGRLKDAYVFDGKQELAAQYSFNRNTVSAKSYGKSTFGGALSSKKTTFLDSLDHSHLYLGTMNGGSPFDMSWDQSGRLSLFFGETGEKTIAELHMDWKRKIDPYLKNRNSQNPIFIFDFKDEKKDNWIQKVEKLMVPKGIEKQLKEITLERKEKILDDEVMGQRKDDRMFFMYLEADASRNGIKGGLKALKEKILEVKNATEKKRLKKYKKMSTLKLAEMRAKKRSR